jgi:ABC-type nitrate/sulfonate/bicarbonate transport system substrate-binding protein
MPKTIVQGKELSTAELDWTEVFYTNCGMVSASNVDQELGWCRTDFKAKGIDYSYFRSRRENDWYPHYIHNLDNLIRFGGLYPPIHVEADIRRTRLLGATPTHEGGCMLVRARDPIFKMSHLKGKRVGLSKSLNTLKNDWWRITEHYGILNMLMLHDMSVDDVQIVEFPYADDWYGEPRMLEPLDSATELYMGKMDHKRNLAFRPLEAALLSGQVDAIYTHSKTWQHLQEDTGKIAAIEDLSRYPDWRLQANNEPTIITCSDVMAEQHPELVVTFMKSMIKVGRWANEHKRAAAVILDRQTYYRDAEDTYQCIKHIDMVPSLSPRNLAQIEIGKDFMLKHGYIKRDFDVQKWAAPEFLEQAARELIEERWKIATTEKLPTPSELQASSRRLG